MARRSFTGGGTMAPVWAVLLLAASLCQAATPDMNIVDASTTQSNLREDAGIGAIVLTVTTKNAGTTISLVDVKGYPGGVNKIADFNVSAKTIKTASPLDYEQFRYYIFTVQATSTTLETTSAQFSLNVIDVDEPCNLTDTNTYTTDLLEERPIGLTVFKFETEDLDAVKDCTCSLTGTDAHYFLVVVDTCTIVTQKRLDFETPPTVLTGLELHVTDKTGNPPITQTLTVTLIDENDNAPDCQPQPYSFAVDENTGADHTVGTLTCTDADDGNNGDIVSYVIFSGDDKSQFKMSDENILTTTVPLDYETKAFYSLTVDVTDNGSPSQTGRHLVHITVNPVNEHQPSFVSKPYVATIDEGAVKNTGVTTVTAKDDDKGDLHGTVHYSITEGNDEGVFTINTATGEIKVTDEPPDWERTTSYKLTIVAEDDIPGSGKKDTATVTVNINDVNDNTPLCTPSSYWVNVTEPGNPKAVLTTLTATDDDGPAFTPLTFSVTDPTFTFNGNDLILNKVVDHETKESYVLTVKVTDKGGLNSNCQVTVIVDGANESPPKISVGGQSFTLSETTNVGHVVFDVDATDDDKGVGGDNITYSIISGNEGGYFLINPHTGVVTVFKRLDYDQPSNSYNMTIMARDNAGGNDTMWLQVILTDTNDETPTFTKNIYAPKLNEGTYVAERVAFVTATDRDFSLAGIVNYTVVGGNGRSLFNVHPSTGEITVTGTVDYESQNRYSLVIEAKDGGQPPLSSTTLVDIKISDQNDNTPKCDPEDYVQPILESTSPGTSVTTVTATDADSADFYGAIDYILSDTYFRVDGKTGEIKLDAKVDRETNDKHVLRVVARDKGGEEGTCTVTMLILDVNDNPPVVSGPYDVTVGEDALPQDIAAALIVTDADEGDNARLTYTITGGNTNDEFTISSTSGIIQVQKPLDREKIEIYELKVITKDNGNTPQETTTTVTITIGDINDNDPVWKLLPYDFTVKENQKSGTPVGTVKASDKDKGENSTLIYTFDLFWVGNMSHFNLDRKTGAITTATELDREETAEYHARLIVADNGNPQRSATVNASITVEDLNDNPPVFDKIRYDISTQENLPVGNGIHTVVVTDADIGTNDDITLSIDTSTPEGKKADEFFEVTSSNGVISIKKVIDREIDQSFSFNLVAEDGKHKTTASVTVTVTDVNDNDPKFLTTYHNTEIAYTGVCTNSIVTVSATDADTGTNAEVTYFLESPATSGTFKVDGTSGEVSLISGLVANSRHYVNVMARDGAKPPRTSSVPALVRVDALYPNDHVVTFKLGITLEAFKVQQDTFLSQLQTMMRVKYPSAVARLWCAEVSSDGLTDAHVYFLSDDSTENVANKDEPKFYVSRANARAVFTSEDDGTPNSALQDSQWETFAIRWVHPYYEKQKPWHETEEGICILIVIALLGVCLLALACYMCFRYCRRMKLCPKPKPKKPKPKKPEPPKKKEPPPPVRPDPPPLPRLPPAPPSPPPPPPRLNSALVFWSKNKSLKS